MLKIVLAEWLYYNPKCNELKLFDLFTAPHEVVVDNETWYLISCIQEKE